jgi:hypothetical protein
MRSITFMAMVLSATAVLGAGTVSAAPGDTFKAKKAACQERAKGMKFGIHLIKKSRWVKDCIAGKHPV